MLGLDGFNTGVTQIAMILPLMLQAPRFFAGAATLGDMHQTVQAFNRLMRALSFFRLFYEQFTLYQARLNRLHSFMTKLDYLDENQVSHPIECGMGVALRDFGLKDQYGDTLLQQVNLELQTGDALLITGSSGAGKTTLLNANILFLPQRPYMPQGSLRDAICYPNIDPYHKDLERYMEECRLGNYIHALDQENDWQVILSPGELQRVAFIRIFLTQPDVVFFRRNDISA